MAGLRALRAAVAAKFRRENGIDVGLRSDAFASCQGVIGKTSPAGVHRNTDEDLVNALLDETGIATVHGSAFGLGRYLRMAYALDEGTLAKACEAIRGFCLAVK